VIDSIVKHFVGFSNDKRALPVLWHQSLLVFAQRYKHDITGIFCNTIYTYTYPFILSLFLFFVFERVAHTHTQVMPLDEREREGTFFCVSQVIKNKSCFRTNRVGLNM
jgi:hypothetical protein